MTDPAAQRVWDGALGQLQMQMTQATFDTWVKDTHVVSLDSQKLVVGTKSAFAKDWLENRLFTTINRTVTNLLGFPVSSHILSLKSSPYFAINLPNASLRVDASTSASFSPVVLSNAP